MIGTLLNVAGILVGGVVGLAWRKGLSPGRESMFKVLLGAFTVFYGLRLTWTSLNGSPLQILKQLVIAVVALMIGKLTGQLLRLQKLSNRIGQMARERIANSPDKPRSMGDGFKTCSALFCAAPLGILGALTAATALHLDNAPRIDAETSQGLVSDVCLKRQVRDYVRSRTSSNGMSDPGYDIFIRSGLSLENRQRIPYERYVDESFQRGARPVDIHVAR